MGSFMAPPTQPGPYASGYVFPSGGGAAPASSGAGSLSAAGGVLAIAGMAASAIGGYYAAKSQKYSLRSSALSADFEAKMGDLNARTAEFDADNILEAGHRELGKLGLQYGQDRGARRASTAAAGVQAGVGSAAEVAASARLAHEIDAMTVNSNAVRAAGRMRTEAVNQRNRSLMSRVSAENMRSAARSINPWVSAGASLLGAAAPVAAQAAFSGGGR